MLRNRFTPKEIYFFLVEIDFSFVGSCQVPRVAKVSMAREARPDAVK